MAKVDDSVIVYEFADGWYVVGKHNGQTSFECYLEVGKTNV